jgi:NAD(P)-dependent dehydrogenase (short-subunit alcohol dehydrogenase family)
VNDFAGKVVLITGAGRGAGSLLAWSFASQGARLALNDISPVNLEELVAGLAGARAYVEDITRKLAVQALVKQVEDDFGRIDILVNHAAIEPHAALLDMDEWDWHRTLDANLTAAFLAMQSVGRMMRAQGAGVIVNVIPAGSRELLKERAAYLASLHGLAALTRAAAQELSEYGVRVHAVGTGLVSLQRADGPVPKGLAEAVLYLCSEAGSGLNGQIINVEEE